MTDASTTTAFRLVRRLAAIGHQNPSLYLLICDATALSLIQADLAAELEVQLGVGLRALAAAEIRPERLAHAFTGAGERATLVSFNHWLPKLVSALDRNIVLLTTAGAVLLLMTQEIAERMLATAPNLRSRLTDVLTIKADLAFGSDHA
jgi:hypothetical protein